MLILTSLSTLYSSVTLSYLLITLTFTASRLSQVAAAIGKVGAFVGTYIYTPLQDRFPEDSNLHFSAPFYVGSGLAVLAVFLIFFFVPPVVTDGIEKMDQEFFAYLAENGYDMTNIGLAGENVQEEEEGQAKERASG